jgi:nucleoside-diphosphate-sugar epimerase
MIAIIGGSGFVGSRIISSLNTESVYNLDKNPSSDYENISSIVNIEYKDQIIFHPKTKIVILLAAEHKDNVTPASKYYDVNVKGTRNVLNQMDEVGIKHIIFTSSVAVYGLNKTNPNENSTLDPFNHYGKSKWGAEQEILNWYRKDQERKGVTILRPTVIFGENNRGNVYNLFKQIHSGKFIMIGKGRNKKSMAYVGNVTAFIKHRINKRELGYNVYNYADKPDLNMNTLISHILGKLNNRKKLFRIPFWAGMAAGYSFDLLSIILQKKLKISSVRIKKFCATTQFDATKAHSEFKAPYMFDESLNITLKHEFCNENQKN